MASDELTRNLLSELLGTFLLVLIGQGFIAIAITGKLGIHTHIGASIGWGLAAFVAVHTTNGASSHLNPAVTLAMASLGRMPVMWIPLYFAMQYTGAFLASAVVYNVYYDWISHTAGNLREVSGPNATAMIFTCIRPDWISLQTAFIDQIVGTAFLLLGVESVVDPIRKIPPNAHPGLIGVLICSIIISMAHNTMAPLNPARDIGPRIFLTFAGYGLKPLKHHNSDWILVSFVAPHIGAILGAWIYKIFIGMWHPPEVPQALPPPPREDPTTLPSDKTY